MKTTHYLYLALCLSAISAVSCTKESENETPVTEFEKCEILAVTETTKTQISESDSNVVIWNSGDALSVFSADKTPANNNKFNSSNISGNSASFSGSIESLTESFYALYPYMNGLSYSEGVISGAVIPTTQTATDNSFANGVALAVAHGTRTPGVPQGSTLDFQNLCAMLAFTLPSNITFANEIIVSSKSGAKMAGSVSIDCANETISGASESSVTLSGSFTGGNTYMIAIAPGTYTGGFSFTINTNGGNSYTRGTTKDVTAEAGNVYKLGKLSLELAETDLSTSVSISHDVESNVLNGSTAKFSITPKSEFASAISKYKVVLNLKNSSSTVCRTLDTEAETFDDTVMDMSNNFYYLPKGDYTYEATVTYYVNNDAKLVAHTFVYSGEVTSPQPSGFTLKADLSGHTSYDTYKSGDVSVANTENGSTIFGIGATYKSGLSNNVYTQCSSLLSITSTLDGSEKSGNQESQSWTAHTIGAKWSFDGAAGTTNTKTVYVTGLPYYIQTSKRSFGWTQTGDFESNNGETAWAVCTGKGQDKTAYALSPAYCVPDDINIKVDVPGYVYCGSISGYMFATMYIGASNTNARVGNGTSLPASGKFPNKASHTTVTRDITLTNSVNKVCVAMDCSRNGSLSVYGIDAGGYTSYINISYR